MKARRKTYTLARAALRLGGRVIVTSLNEVFVAGEEIGVVNNGQASKLLHKGAAFWSSPKHKLTEQVATSQRTTDFE